MDFAPTEADRALKRLAGDFARREIAPRTEAIDREKDPEKRLPDEILRAGAALGLRTLAVPESAGGGGVHPSALCPVAEELGRADLGIALPFTLDWALAHAASLLWEDATFHAFAGEFTRDDALHLACAEIGSGQRGSDAPDGHPTASIQEREGALHLVGRARRVLHGSASGFLLLHVRGEEGQQVFLLENEAARGVRVAHRHDPMGMRACPDVDVLFTDVDLSSCRRVDCTEDAWREATHALRVLPASAAVGTAHTAHEHALHHARERVQGGKPIIEHQTVGFMLCDNLMELEAATQCLAAAARAAERGGGDPWRSILAEAFAAEACERVARRAMEVWGGAGYMTEAPMERLLRDVVAFVHAFGSGHAARTTAMGLL